MTNILRWAFAILVALIMWPIVVGLVLLAIDVLIIVVIALFIVSLLNRKKEKL